ncbi:hypothetical protein [Cupriavidus basilensis]|uniref:hypothetical protein n=1 Tax=Cupriavidus basilensis TaxID=68895 RepID=UPI0039F69AE4
MPLRDIRSTFLPYCVERQPDGRYAVLNREYKPVGFWTNAYVTYADYPILVKIKGLTPKRASLISHDESSNTDLIFLYDDGCVPTESAAHMNAYLKRLAVLAKLEIDGTPAIVHPHTPLKTA